MNYEFHPHFLRAVDEILNDLKNPEMHDSAADRVERYVATSIDQFEALTASKASQTDTNHIALYYKAAKERAMTAFVKQYFLDNAEAYRGKLAYVKQQQDQQ